MAAVIDQVRRGRRLHWVGWVRCRDCGWRRPSVLRRAIPCPLDTGRRENTGSPEPLDEPTMNPSYAAFHRRSIDDREGVWAEQAQLIDWHKPFDQVCDYSRPPFARWFVGGQTNLCHNAFDRHLKDRAAQNALIFVSTEVDHERIYSFRELHAEVQRMAAVLLALGVKQGDRVLVYMPMIPEAVFAMLACVRIGAIHSVVFGGFASGSLASRIDDATPCVIVSADAGSRSGKVVAYKPLLDEAIRLAAHKPAKVLLVDGGLSAMERVAGRDVDYAALRERHLDTPVPCAWLDAEHVSYTSGSPMVCANRSSTTTGRPRPAGRSSRSPTASRRRAASSAAQAWPCTASKSS
jgi:propionyl-CoA synthetase